ncbi:hypothetical protein [Wenxinia saemankumensis]|uniref:Uncharacterized protein n=1 Tax=Wenxinia saemankumensis TaxID=1447782 RepID=A0A1M6FL70_9RHOB|nr:hypothetical protein [Wenxinia saemankumensis]SHI98383.1 hypothetical protein SAMN05444417_2380 [Wenxinia saemankumensis]
MRRIAGRAGRAACLLAALGAGPLAAQVADGTYDVGACGETLSDARVVVAGTQLTFAEASCRLTNPTNVRDMGEAILWDAECSGEGETYTRRYLLMQGPSGRLVIVQAGFATTYVSCPPE